MLRFFVFMFLFSLTGSQLLLESKIIEIQNFSNIYDHISGSPLICIDIDETILTQKEMLGTCSWFFHRLEFLKKGKTPFLASLQSNIEFTGIQNLIKPFLVEREIPSIIRNLQQQGYSLLGFTKRAFLLKNKTLYDLDKFNINFNYRPFFKKEVFIYNPNNKENLLNIMIYSKGVFFCSNENKGASLIALLKETNKTPNSILFIDDDLKNLKDLEETCKNSNLKFTGLLYTKLSAPFLPEIAEVQFHNLMQVTPDNEVLHQIYN